MPFASNRPVINGGRYKLGHEEGKLFVGDICRERLSGLKPPPRNVCFCVALAQHLHRAHSLRFDQTNRRRFQAISNMVMVQSWTVFQSLMPLS
jgi:hypothetical protein